LPKVKSLAKNRNRFFQKRKVKPRRDIGFANKEKFNQEEM
jgi:hypothetical protein